MSVQHSTVTTYPVNNINVRYAQQQLALAAQQRKCLHVYFSIDKQPVGDVAYCSHCKLCLGVVGMSGFGAYARYHVGLTEYIGYRTLRPLKVKGVRRG
jgi:hypothetical protein